MITERNDHLYSGENVTDYIPYKDCCIELAGKKYNIYESSKNHLEAYVYFNDKYVNLRSEIFRGCRLLFVNWMESK